MKSTAASSRRSACASPPVASAGSRRTRVRRGPRDTQDFSPETRLPIANLRKRRLLAVSVKSPARDPGGGWLGRQDSNRGMAESKSAALPLGHGTIRRLLSSGSKFDPTNKLFPPILRAPLCRRGRRWLSIRAHAKLPDAMIQRRRPPTDTDFFVQVNETAVIVRFRPTRTTFEFHRFTNQTDIVEFGPLSPDPRIERVWPNANRGYNSAEVLTMAFRRALAAVRR
jgi:hypothetical protein